MISTHWDFPPAQYSGNLNHAFVTNETIAPAIARFTELASRNRVAFSGETIGSSKDGRAVVGFRIGSGPHHVSITAGAHADEPTGPMAALGLVEWLLSGHTEALNLTKSCTVFICPQVNPDGAEANRKWFRDPINPLLYWNTVIREQPGDDIEFGYPGDGKPALRPENAAVARFLQEGAPYVFHASLHAMAAAEGAWFLIGGAWRDKTHPLQSRLGKLAIDAGLGLHDMDRRGDKGFSRISKGFCTTPTSAGMRKHFLDQNDPASAELFHLNSMEFVESLGGAPLVMVSEMPLFLVGRKTSESTAEQLNAPPPQPGATAYEQFRAALQALRVETSNNQTALAQLASRFSLRPVPLPDHVQMQGLMVLEALAFLEATDWKQ